MSKKIVIGNFKMNLTASELRKYLNAFVPDVEHASTLVGLAVPYTNLAVAKRSLKETGILLGAQNVSGYEQGAYTGEVSARMLLDAGCKMTLVGHSERRKLFLEQNSNINNKIKQNLKYNLISVLCVGESKRERISNQTKAVLCKQIDECLAGLYENELENIIIAYEPVWAIGTGDSATPKQVEEAISIIREEIARNYSEKIAKKINVLYGGSINLDNYKNYIGIKNMNGFLVGGLCLNAQNFSQMIKDIKAR